MQITNAASYAVQVSNAGGSFVSPPVALTVNTAVSGAVASLATMGPAVYTPAGGNVTLAAIVSYAGLAPTALSFTVNLPTGWALVSTSGANASPVGFSYTLHVPAGTTGPQQLAALVLFRQSGNLVQFMASPDPLLLAEAPAHHSADTNMNFRISLLELTRVIELYNTRNGTTRTGCYKVEAGTEDGFGPEPSRTAPTVATLTKYHSADPDRNGKISLLELTRVIELYNYRVGTTRTGGYHVHADSEDGFNPGPLSGHPGL